MELYVSNLSYDLTDEELKQAFAAFGEVRHATVIKDKATGRSRGFGFVDMPDPEAAKSAITGLSGRLLRGRPAAIREARPRGEMPPPGARPPLRPGGAPGYAPRPDAGGGFRPGGPPPFRPGGPPPGFAHRPPSAGGGDDRDDEEGADRKGAAVDPAVERAERARRHQFKQDAVHRPRRVEASKFEDGLAKKMALKRDQERRTRSEGDDESEELDVRVR